jgi:hypothetical protein
MAISYGSLPFNEQLSYFRDKINLPTRSWTDIYTVEHDYAFVVAGAIKRDLLVDLRAAVEKSIAKGTTLEQFRKDFDQVIGKHGWQYQGERGWRTNVIWETNLRQSYNAGREAQMADPELRKRRPYGLYRHGDSAHPRPQHLAWNGTTLPLDDPWWATHSPQNGWGCKCKKFMLSARDVERQGLKVGPAPAIEWEDRTVGKNSPNGARAVRVPKGIDPGFEHAPGQSRLDAGVPPLRAYDPLPQPTLGAKYSATSAGLPNRSRRDAMPSPRPASAARILLKGLNDQQHLERFLGEFGATEMAPAVFKDVTGDTVVIGRGLFSNTPAGPLLIQRSGVARELLLLADALKSPDEIWVRMEWLENQSKAVVRRRYLRRFKIDGQATPALAVFEIGDDGWAGVSSFEPDANNGEYLTALRQGIRLYRRAE